MSYVTLLYGSRARGEADALSDTDVIRISDDPRADYTWSEISLLRASGSLFLWHLHLEGKIIDCDAEGEEDWTAVTTNIPTYKHAGRDLEAFEVVLRDVAGALQTGDTDIIFEGGVLARTIRHAAILGCYLGGTPVFSRYGAVATAAVGLSVSEPRNLSFEALYECVNAPEVAAVEAEDLQEWVERGCELVMAMRHLLVGSEGC